MKFGALTDLHLELPGTRVREKLNATVFTDMTMSMRLTPLDRCRIHGFSHPGARACLSSTHDSCYDGDTNLTAHSCEAWATLITAPCGSSAQHVPPMCDHTLGSARLKI
jgi:hypothetical protein